MGSYVLYLLTQAFVAMVFAYMAGTLAMRERRVPTVLVATGLYLLLGASMMELWGDRAGWSPERVAIHVALVATGITAIGAGCLHRELIDLGAHPRLKLVPLVLLIVAVVTGAALGMGAGSSFIVDASEAVGHGPSGGFTRLGPGGWALGSPLFIGAALILLSGLRASLARRDGRGTWLLASGVMFMLWPLALGTESLPISPSLMVLAIAMTYFGFQPPEATEGDQGVEGEVGEPRGTVADGSGVTEALGKGGDDGGKVHGPPTVVEDTEDADGASSKEARDVTGPGEGGAPDGITVDTPTDGP